MRRWVVAAAVLAIATLAPVTVSAALLWTLVASPPTAVANQSTTFTFTATNLDLLQVLGCLEVDLPGSFLITGTGTPTTNNGDAWVSSVSGNAVVVHSIDGGGRLKLLETVTFTVQAQPTVAGAFSLPNHSHVRDDCTGTDQAGVALPITVLPGATPRPVPTPVPTPTPTPTPSPTPTPPSPTPTPLPVPSLPLPSLPLPTLPVASAPPTTPPLPEATPTPRATEGAIAASSPDSASPNPSRRSSATPVASDSADPSGAGPGPVSGGPTGGGGDGGTPAVRLEPRELTLNTELVDLLGSPQVWFVPAAAIGAPGLLVLLWVALQTVGTMAWIPSVRRMRGEERRGSSRSRRVGAR